MEEIYKPERVKQLFNQMSDTYERMNFITSFGFSIRWRRQFLEKLKSSKDSLQVLDLLSGLGENWNYLKNKFPNATFSALDFSEQMVLKSEQKSRKVFNQNFKQYCEDVLENTLPSEAYDVVSCAYGLKTFNQQQLEILSKELYRIMRSGGVFSFVEVSKPNNKILYSFYKLYLKRIIPILGKLFLGNPNDYKMLWVYTERFENSKKVKEIFEKQGFEIHYENYFFGCASGISGRKQ
ncbi:ubiquinone biosynthesis protein [Elizabethkingia meningoseptica]|uniref:class I SAM-dependent methyltransferase n=1 Tax=Elizabethkingia meningoseptica TaxID=238 RepID=UPI000332C523|nr:class I SAM-dependent methyltransferase [Elizabethkingia meningoseptica]AQX46009.1 ubiquinone biosynthesis protein [Elizabethkingia meningoseptica]EOR30331.1 methylase involved in ubiquinone/menaquinone biosynthesis [Elizabethkingia meningoseptica ATCC 13253 = NBRC 12535]KUY15301.1 ubiquinone biosynthesis protein [Elizabethkingia meningoseptica]MCL1677263.1 class I SAM-dependent methyltransferase [Elizabethkingia meningoseptica]MCL1687488.1 class I SAM-dependent methyltransferase [Elizabeth